MPGTDADARPPHDARLPDDVARAIHTLDAFIGDPHPGGLPLDLFLFVSRVVPLFTVDAWIEDDAGYVLLTWRDDPFFGRGWHVPGSVLRYGETADHRLRACALEEVGAEITHDALPFDLMEEIQPGIRGGTRDRGHNVSAAYRCRLATPPDPARAYRPEQGAPQPGQWAWFDSFPDPLLPVHQVYARHFERLQHGTR